MKTYCLDVLDTVTYILSCSVKKDEIREGNNQPIVILIP